MRKVFTRIIFGVFSFMLFAVLGQAQNTRDTLYRGDMNNSGAVNAVDLLYLGHVFGETGPERLQPSFIGTNNNLEDIGPAFMYAKTFDDGSGIDIVHADANGDGKIDDLDLDQFIVPNIEDTHAYKSLPSEGYLNGQEFVHSPLKLVSDFPVVETGGTIALGIELGSAELPVSNFYGLAFTMSYEANFIDDNSPFAIVADGSGWTNNIGGDIRQFVYNNEATGKAEYVIVKTDKTGTGFTDETIGVLSLIVDDIVVMPIGGDTLTVTIDSVRMIDDQFNTIPVDLSCAKIDIAVFEAERSEGSNCPETFDPVCGSDGNSYQNSCFAEAAGVTEYTSGTCFGACVDPTAIDSSIPCDPEDQDKVCGCNGETYLNACDAQNSGVSSYTLGPCSLENNCVDLGAIISSGHAKPQSETGVIQNNCDDTLIDLVCGCNGITYQNSCFAEISGVLSYTAGDCASLCIDPTAIDPSAACETTFAPVCGCNDVTYNNACLADAAGVQTYTIGACGNPNSINTWCATATPISCGDLLLNQSTTGEMSDFSAYPILPNFTLLGPDKVYNLNKTTTGDLQITLEITTPNLDLDLFLIKGECYNYEVIAGSWSNNQLTSTETIILEDAEIGNYYIVVDGQYPATQGDFRIEVSCGYLDCNLSDATELTCGHPLNYNNAYGQDNVSVYTCDGANTYSNSGPEVVHKITTTATGQLEVTLSNLDANLNMYLLNGCDFTQCIENSTNAGNWNEYISAYVPAGTYYIVVDGYNGATSNYSLLVECAQTCDIDVNATATYASCGQNSGTINVSSTGGTPGYLVSYTGPITGSFYTYAANCTISNLPPGTYTVTKTDANGCSDYAVVTINDGSNLNFSTWVTDATCGMGGVVEVTIANGAAPYTIVVTGPKNLQLAAYSNTANINNLLAGTYTIQVQDAYGCSSIQQVIVGDSNSGFNYTATGNPANCGQLGSITVNIPAPFNTQNPFNIQLEGPVSGFDSTNSSNFNIVNLPGGTYNLTIENEFWCQQTQVVVIPDNYMTIGTNVSAGICGQDGSITLSISNGTPSYHVQWSGQETGSTWISNPNYTIDNLATGTYTVSVTDGNGCTDYEVVQINNTNSYLNTAAIPINGSCGNGSIWLDIQNGNAPYTISWTGAATGFGSTSNDGFDIQNLPVGTYTVNVQDANGCTSVQVVNLGGTGSNLGVTATGTSGSCGTNGSIWLSMTNGVAPYNIAWDGTASGATSAQSSSHDIPNLGSGTYNITVTDVNGCSDETSVTINNSSVYLNIFTNTVNSTCGQNGSIWVTLSGGTPNYDLTWTGPVSGSTTTFGSFDIANLPTGVYTIAATDENGCSSSQSVTIYDQSNNLNVSPSVVHESCGGSGSIALAFSGGNAPYTIDWMGAIDGTATTMGNTYNIYNLWAGTYIVVITDASGCSETITTTINGYQGLSLTTMAVDCVCGKNGSVWLGMLGGSAPYTVNWSGEGVTGSSITPDLNYDIMNLDCGSYAVTVTDVNGCAATTAATILEGPSNLDVSLWGTDGVCGGYGAIEVSMTGGSGAYTVSWSGASTGNVITNNANYVISNIPTGAYTVNVEDAGGCTTTENITINQTGGLSASLWGTDGVCGGYGAIEVTMTNGNGNYTISWSGASSGNIITNNSSYVISNIPAGAYTVNVEDASGCTTTENITINQTGGLSASLWGTEGVCGGYGAIEITLTGGTADYTIAWSGAGSGNVTTSNSTYVMSNLATGTYTVSVTDANNCTTTENITINQTGGLSASLWGTDGVCGGYGAIEITLTGGTADYTIAWSGAGSGNVTTSNSTYVMSNLATGTYTVSVTDANNCTTTENITINQTGGLSASLWGTDGVCGGYGAIEITLTGGTADYTIAWSGAGSGNVTTSNSTYVMSNLATGTYTVSVTDANNCTTTENITINQTGGLSASLWGTDGVCGGYGAIEITLTGGTADYTIAWSGAGSGNVTTSNSTYVMSNLATGTYTVSVTDANNCTTTENITINQTGGLSASLSANNGLCGSYGSIDVNITGGSADYTIAWSGAGSGNVTTNNSSYVLSNLVAGNYTVSVTDTNGCNTTETVSVYNTLSDLSMTASVTNGVCGTTGSIWVDITGGTADYTVTWSGTAAGTATTSTAYDINDLATGSYTITVKDANNCTVSQTVNVSNGNNNLQVNTSAVDGTCGNSASIWVSFVSGTPAYLLEWTGPSTGSTTTNQNAYAISNLSAGSYAISVTDLNGCTYTETVTVQVGAGNFSLTANGVNGSCGSNGAITINTTGGTPDYTISWSGPVTGSTTVSSNSHTIPNLPVGSYNVMVVDNYGCGQSDNVYIGSGNSNLSVSTVVYPAYCNQPASGSVWLDITGGAAPLNITWTGATSGSATTTNDYYEIENLNAGSHTIVVTDANGCADTEIVTVNSNTGNLSLTATATNAYCNAAGSILLELGSGAADFSITWTGPTNGFVSISNNTYEILNAAAGTYTITATDANGCSTTETVVVNTTGGNLSLTTTVTDSYCGVSGSIAVAISGGNSAYTVAWSGTSAGSQTINSGNYTIPNLYGGSYMLTVTDANGCSTTEAVTINSGGGNLSITTTPTDSYCGVAGSIWVGITGGAAAYTVAWSGTSAGSETTSAAGYTIPNLNAGSYTITVTDANNCTETANVVVNGSAGTLGATITGSDAYCNLPGSIWIVINNGNPSYTVEWSGPISGSATTGVTYDIPGTPAGTYTVTVTDANNCSVTQTVVIANNVSSLAVTSSATNASCGVPGSVWLTMSGGAAPYDITWTGTGTGMATTSSATYDVPNLSAGTYTFSVTDANGCTVTETATVAGAGSNLAITANPTNGDCGAAGSIWVTIAGGSAPYAIEWDGTSTGTSTTSSAAYDISGLSLGNYGITVTDATGCSGVQAVSISGSVGLSATFTPTNGSCNSNDGEINVVVNNGSPNYNVFWTGPVSNSAILTGNTITIDNLPSGDYTVSVEDANLCSYTENITITNGGGGSNPVAGFTTTNNVLTLTTTNTSTSATSYTWDFGDGNTSTDANPVYDFCEEGTFNVCLTATNACGTDTYCANVTMTIPSSICVLDVGELNASPNSTIYLPVTGDNCNLIASLAGSLEVENMGVATIIGLSPGAISPQFNSVDQTFNYYDNSGQGVTVANGNILFYLVVQLGNGMQGQSTNIAITNNPLMVEFGTIVNGIATAMPVLGLKGQVTIENSANISGNVYNYWAEGIKDVAVKFTDVATENSAIEMTDENGEYMHPDVPMNNMYMIHPEKDGNDANGLSTFALFVGQRFILGMDPLEITSPYQVIAGDANCSGSFTTLDLFLIQQIIIGTNNEFTACPSWVFVNEGAGMPDEFNAYNVFPYENGDTMMITQDTLVDFVGVKVGDILGHANPHNFGGYADERVDNELTLQVAKSSYQAGETVELNFRSPNFLNIVSYQLGLNFDNSKLEFEAYEEPANPSLSSTAIGTANAVKGDLRVSWFSTNGSSVDITQDEALFTLKFTALEDIHSIENLLSLNSDNILSEAHDGDLDRMDIVIEFVSPTTAVETVVEKEGYNLVQNTPNPFTTSTAITFELPTAMSAEIMIHNQLGEVLYVVDGAYNQGLNTVTIAQDKIGTGVFYYTLKTDDFTATRSMISIK